MDCSHARLNLMPMKTKEEQREYQRQWIKQRRDAFFANKVCIQCGSTEKLELDHINNRLKVSHRIWSWSQIRREVEIAKCQILCHACHLGKTVTNQEKPFGERIGNSKLTEEQVQDILVLLRQNIPHRIIAKKFGVVCSTITNINTGKGWKHLNPR